MSGTQSRKAIGNREVARLAPSTPGGLIVPIARYSSLKSNGADDQDDEHAKLAIFPDQIFDHLFHRCPKISMVPPSLFWNDRVLMYMTIAFMLALNEPGSTRLVESMTIAMLARIKIWCQTEVLPPDERALRDRICKVEEYIEGNLGKPLLISELAGVANMSPYHFARSFKRVIGESPRKYIIRRRVVRAQAMILDDATHSFAEIAFACGFASQSHMNTAFRQIAGCTPGEFRRKAT